MFDINYIINGNKSKKKVKDPFMNILPTSQPVKPLKSMPQKVFLQKTKRNPSARFTDHDKDGVISGLDCYPFNKRKHNTTQVLWHAGNKKPSETLRDEGRVYGFSDRRYAEGWQQQHNKEKIYQFTTDKYDLDDKQYMRKTPQGKELSDNEYIAYDVNDEEESEDANEKER